MISLWVRHQPLSRRPQPSADMLRCNQHTISIIEFFFSFFSSSNIAFVFQNFNYYVLFMMFLKTKKIAIMRKISYIKKQLIDLIMREIQFMNNDTLRNRLGVPQWKYNRVEISSYINRMKWEKISSRHHFIFFRHLSISTHSNKNKSLYHFIFSNWVEEFFKISIIQHRNFWSNFISRIIAESGFEQKTQF